MPICLDSCPWWTENVSAHDELPPYNSFSAYLYFLRFTTTNFSHLLIGASVHLFKCLNHLSLTSSTFSSKMSLGSRLAVALPFLILRIVLLSSVDFMHVQYSNIHDSQSALNPPVWYLCHPLHLIACENMCHLSLMCASSIISSSLSDVCLFYYYFVIFILDGFHLVQVTSSPLLPWRAYITSCPGLCLELFIQVLKNCLLCLHNCQLWFLLHCLMLLPILDFHFLMNLFIPPPVPFMFT